VLRKGYPVLTTPGPDFAGQLIRTLNFYAGDLTPAILFVIPGIFYIFRVNRKVFYVLSYLFAADTAAAVIYNGMRAEPPATMATFILPGIYAAAIYAAAGIYYCLSLLKGRVKAGAAAGAALIIVFAGWANFDRNNLSLDFTAYDHGENILKTMGKNAVYIAAGDVNLAPLYYLQYVEKQRPDVEITSIKFLNTKFGHDEFLSLHPDARLKAGATQENAAEIIRYFSGTRPVYWAGFSIAPAQGIKQSRCGMLFTAGEISNNDIYKIYSYRGTGYR
jgi:hypothetical protein